MRLSAIERDDDDKELQKRKMLEALGHAHIQPEVLFRQFPPLDAECERCKGDGYYYERQGINCELTKVECSDCDGHGRIPTEFGEAVLKFVQSRIRITTKVDR